MLNPKIVAFIAEHGVSVDIGRGAPEIVLPLDKIQAFLDLIQPGDVPPEMLQRLYQMQQEGAATLTRQVAHWSATGKVPPSAT